jgi:MoaA/NifB/PqqE/SkfB family radical SAM enzyme
MTPELQQQYDAAAQPFIANGSAISLENTRMKSWRYFLEINSACNLHCPTCTKGNTEGYEHQNGIMDADLMEACLDKIRNENYQAIVFLYGNSEPFIHPRLAECVASVKRRGLNCQLSTNLNFIRNVEGVLDAGPDMIIISLSGFTQEVYVKGHAGGDIEKVKANMKILGEAYAKTDKKTAISVNYHVYNDNEHEIAPMKAYAESLGIGFFTSLARAISMENAIQFLRESEERESGQPAPYAVQEGKPDYNKMLPPVKNYATVMERLKIPPQKARGMYKDLPFHSVCPVGDMFTFIRHDGKTSMCACVADRRLTLGNFLETNQEEFSERRRGHPICQQCLKYRMSYYFHIVDRNLWM